MSSVQAPEDWQIMMWIKLISRAAHEGLVVGYILLLTPCFSEQNTRGGGDGICFVYYSSICEISKVTADTRLILQDESPICKPMKAVIFVC